MVACFIHFCLVPSSVSNAGQFAKQYLDSEEIFPLHSLVLTHFLILLSPTKVIPEMLTH